MTGPSAAGVASGPQSPDAGVGGTGPGAVPADPASVRRASGATVGFLVGAVFAAIGALMGSGALDDNSFFTHLATGRLMLDEGLVRADPYTFTSGGESWVVQSWGASLLYGAVDALAGGLGLRLLTAFLTATLTALVWRLTRSAGGLVPRAAVTALVLAVGERAWTERPLLIGLVCLAATLVVVEEDRDPRWLIPVFFLWVNVHGSFPLGLVAVGAILLGRHVDRARRSGDLRMLAMAALGCGVAGVLNPYGVRLLLFPLGMLGRSEILQSVIEWRSPSFDEPWTRAFLVAIAALVVAMMRRPRVAAALPALVFVAAGLVSARNIGVAVVVLAPALASGFGDLGTLRADLRRRTFGPAAVGLVVAVGAAIGVAAAGTPHFGLRGYPVAATSWMEDQGLLRTRLQVAHQDVVGNYLELRYGADAFAFVDDRFELHDPALIEDYLLLARGEPGWDAALERHDIEVILWQEGEPLDALLEASPAWDVETRIDGWLVACPAAGCPVR